MIEQGSEDWKAQRCGKVTASRMSDMLARTKTGWGASRANYMAELLTERLTGKPSEGWQSKEMQWGTETEPQARAAYEFFHGVTVDLAEFTPHPTIADAGASPDGLVGADGLVEIKCPNTATHIETLLSGLVPDKYVMQMQWQMACTGRQWADFASFDPRLPPHLQLFVRRVERDAARIAEMETEAMKFLDELDAKIEALAIKYPEAA